MSKPVNPLTFKIGNVWTSAEGSSVKHDLDAVLEFDPREINAISSFTAELMLIKLKEEISVLLTNGSVKVRLICTRCLKQFTRDIEIKAAERQFYAKEPSHKEEDINDIFLINMKDLTIDLSEMIRQEIILHFPFIAVCSTGCKGLCQRCGKDRNKRPCNCKAEITDSYQPFKDIKKLLK